jgi:tetratricopeptide (TPR) repeat protein
MILVICIGIGLVVMFESTHSISEQSSKETFKLTPQTYSPSNSKPEPKYEIPPLTSTPAIPRNNTVSETPALTSSPNPTVESTITFHDNVNLQANLTPINPLQVLIDYLDQKQFQKLIQTFDEGSWDPNYQTALSYRTAALIQLTEQYLEQKKYHESIFMLEHHLNMTTDYAAIYSLLAETHVLQGQVKNALDILEEGYALVKDREQAKELRQAQLTIVDQHLEFLQKNEHWKREILSL